MKAILSITVLLLTLNVFGQNRDFQSWYVLGLEYKISEKLSLGVENETRLRENSSIMERNQTDLGLSFSLNSKWSAGLTWRYLAEDPFLEGYSTSHRFAADVSRKWKPQRFEISMRLRFITDNEEGDVGSTVFSQLIHREKLTIRYDLPKTSLTPVLAAEVYFPANNSFYLLEKSRLYAGLTYKVTKMSRLGLFAVGQWRYQEETPTSDFAVMIEYQYKLN